MRPNIDRYVVCALAIGLGVTAGAVMSHFRKHATATMPAPVQAELAPPVSPGPVPERSPPVRETPSQSYLPPAQPAARNALPDEAKASPPPSRLTRDTVIALAEQCAPSEPSVVLASIARVESAYDPLRIGVNGPKPYALKPHSQEEAVALASHLIASGKNIDLGLAQINSRNLERLALTVQSAFDACRNLAAAAVIMGRGYKAALTISPQGRPLLQTAYSLYNTGDPIRGLANGYVDKVETARQR